MMHNKCSWRVWPIYIKYIYYKYCRNTRIAYSFLSPSYLSYTRTRTVRIVYNVKFDLRICLYYADAATAHM